MSGDGTAGEQVWLYDGSGWALTDDPITWSAEGDVVAEKYAEAGYSENSSEFADPFLVLGLGIETARPAAQLRLFVREDPPQALISVEGPAGSTRTVYATRFPDGLDLMARWAPIAQAGALTALASDLLQPSTSSRGEPDLPPGLVESVVRRAASIL